MKNFFILSNTKLRDRVARENRNSFIDRVGVSNGFVVDTSAIYEIYKLGYEQFGNNFPRHLYSRDAAVKLNNISNSNLLTFTNDFTNGAWVKTDVTVTPNAVANPVDGLINANLITEGSSNTSFILQTYTTGVGATCTNSIYIKKNLSLDWVGFAIADSGGNHGALTYFNLSTGERGSTILLGTGISFNTRMESLGNSWYRLVVSGNNPTYSSYRISIRSASANNSTVRVANCSYYIYGAQAQTGSVATDYIPRLDASLVSVNQSYVQTLYDLNNVAPIDAIQNTPANQPYWFLDRRLNIRVPLFDGLNDFMGVNDLTVFSSQEAGSLLAVANDLNRVGGDLTHFIVITSTGLGGSRLTLATKATTNVFGALGRKLDSDSLVTSSVANSDNYNLLGNITNWSANSVQLYHNGNFAPAGTYLGSELVTAATNSTEFSIGSAASGTVNRFYGTITNLIVDRSTFTTTQLAAIRELQKAYNSQLP